MRVLRSRVAIAVVALVIGAGVATGIAMAAIPDSTNGTVTVCYPTTGTNKGALRVIDYQSGQRCNAGEASVTWPGMVCSGYPHASIDWHGCDFHNAGLQNQYFYAANLSTTKLNSAILNGANLNLANLTSANLSGAYLKAAKLHGANLTNANMSNAVIWNSGTLKTDMTNVAGLTSAQLRSVYQVTWGTRCGVTYGPNLQGVDLHGVSLAGFDLRGAGMMAAPATMNNMNLSGAKSRRREPQWRERPSQHLQQCEPLVRLDGR